MNELSQETVLELKQLFDALSKVASFPTDKNAQSAGDVDNIRAHFLKVEDRIDEIISTVESDSTLYFKLFTMKNSLVYEEAKIRLNREDINTAQELLDKTFHAVFEYRKHPQVAFLYLRVVNHLAYLLSKKVELGKAQSLLEEVTNPDSKPAEVLVYSTEDLFSNKEIDQSYAVAKLGKLMANNLQMLGWVYGKMGNHEMYTLKLHQALQQLLDICDSDFVQWGCRCIRLALLFLNKCRYVTARYHLAAAGHILDKLDVAMCQNPELGKAQADLARCWIHYGLHLFGTSKKYILERMCKEDVLDIVADEDPQADVEVELEETLKFSGLDVVVDPVPAKIIKTTDQARNLFNYTYIWVKRVRVYYTIRDYPILYVNAILNQSELYRYLAFYEPDLDSQYKVQKLRADSLEQLSSILKEVRPKCYIAISVELLRELAEVQIELMGINLRKLYSEGQADSESEVRRRIQAVSDIHSKLESMGDMLGHESFEDNHDMLQESQMTIPKKEEENVKEEDDEHGIEENGNVTAEDEECGDCQPEWQADEDGNLDIQDQGEAKDHTKVEEEKLQDISACQEPEEIARLNPETCCLK